MRRAVKELVFVVMTAGIISSIYFSVLCKKYSPPAKQLEEVVRGIPVSVKCSYNSLSVVLKDSKGKYLLGNACRFPISDISDAAALIESEMKDGDNEPVKLRGYRQGNRMNINFISANGYTINLK